MPVSLLLLIVVEHPLHQGVEFAPLLLRGTARTAVAEDEDRLAWCIELVELLLRGDVEAVVGHEFRPLTARHEVEYLVLVGDGLAAHGEDVANLHLARRLGVTVIHRHTVVANGIGGIAACLEDAHGPQILI